MCNGNGEVKKKGNLLKGKLTKGISERGNLLRLQILKDRIY